jgi:ATP-dependent helicase HrpA
LAYRFEPGASDDGVTLVIPLAALSQVDERQCEWLVPGLLEEKVLALMKSLPQRLRRNLVPLQAWVDRFMARFCEDDQSSMRRSLLEVLIEQAREDGGTIISAHDFRQEQLPRHLHMHFRLIDQHDVVLGTVAFIGRAKEPFWQPGTKCLTGCIPRAWRSRAVNQAQEGLGSGRWPCERRAGKAAEGGTSR